MNNQTKLLTVAVAIMMAVTVFAFIPDDSDAAVGDPINKQYTSEPDGNIYKVTYIILSEGDGQNPGTVSVALNGNRINAEHIIIESTVEDDEGNQYTVTETGYDSFQRAKEAVEIVIPDTIETIGEGSFKDLDNLTSINLPSNLKTIGDYAFNGTGLTTVDIPDTLQTIGDFAFSGPTFDQIVIPDSVQTIGDSAFYNMNASSESVIILGSGITSMGNNAFKVTGDNTVIYFGDNASIAGAFSQAGKVYSLASGYDAPYTITEATNEAPSYLSLNLPADIDADVRIVDEDGNEYSSTEGSDGYPFPTTPGIYHAEIVLSYGGQSVTLDTSTVVNNDTGAPVIRYHDGDTVVRSVFYNSGMDITDFQPTARSGLEFVGWYMDENGTAKEAKSDTSVTEDLDLYAVYAPERPVFTVTVEKVTEGEGDQAVESIVLGTSPLDNTPGVTYTYQWKDGDSTSTDPTYPPSDEDAMKGITLTVTASYTNSVGSATVVQTATSDAVPALYQITLEGMPDGASVSYSGLWNTGVTSTEDDTFWVPAGHCHIEVYWNGETVSRDIEVSGNTTVTVDFTLIRTITVHITPEDATYSVSSPGSTVVVSHSNNSSFDVMVGETYILTFKCDGYVEETMILQVDETTSDSIYVDLEPVSENPDDGTDTEPELPPFIPFPPEQGGDPVEVGPIDQGSSSSSDDGDDTLKVVAVAAAAVIAAILVIVLASTYRHD